MSQRLYLSGRWARALLVGVCALVFLVPGPVTASNATGPSSPREFVVASVEVSLAYRFWDSAVNTLVYAFGVCDSAGVVGTTCYELHVDYDEGDVGIPLWWTASDPYFTRITGYLTNGMPNMTEPGVFERQTGNGAYSNQLESVYFGAQARNGVDLAGFTIQRIGVVLDQIRISPDYPNHATDWAIHGKALFTQQATKDACRDSGWNVLRRMDGSSFKNQGDCIQYVNTGK